MDSLMINPDIKEKYNDSLNFFNYGSGNLVGDREQLLMLSDIMQRPETPSAIILGEQGIGKTAMLEQWLYENPKELMISLNIEQLGALGDNKMVARMSTILDDMNLIKQEMLKTSDEYSNFILFIDEIHKLYRYRLSNGSSGAMNALKEGLARGKFPVIAATTDYEYRKMIVNDPAFDRRFSKITMEQPNSRTVFQILKRRLDSWASKQYIPSISDEILKELIDLTNVYIRNQVNPAKSISMLESAVSHKKNRYNATNIKTQVTYKTLKFIFRSEGYNIDSPATALHVRKEVENRIKGQPLAVKTIGDAINATFYTKRDRLKQMMTLFSVGTAGTGKTKTAKALAHAFFGRDDALLLLNGGDYSTPEDAVKAQHFIGDQMTVNKQKVIVLDEIEKSHPDLLYSYMRMIDDGIVRDSHNIESSINNTVIIANSNLGA